MCGRFVTPGQQDIEQLWHVRGTEGLFAQSYNVAPTVQIPIVYMARDDGSKRLALARWGLVPFWAKGPKPPSHTFNTRLENAASKPMWRQPFRSARCINDRVGRGIVLYVVKVI